ncbi:vascular-related unknown protein 1-like [Punica granatum]|uniref:Uncharacterized protein n=2 Tax=Punica granatum TaxID=22663 RepID=A0A218XV62_PUNGR|nr:vascular-related unknown protein 1-like [Punica granatum]OWM88740.1 hypothetical protein CDL15_Pgr002507 [Punica granatum]PKI55876.1 hypothetical protein CRG98_023757 [Punica granatum]
MGTTSASSSARSIDSARSESSWTPYIVDFLIHNDNFQERSCSLSPGSGDDEYRSSTIVSDAAAMKFSNGNSGWQGGSPKRILNLRKRKTKEEFLVDEALEDTASSPNNSPKICGFKRPDIYSKKRDDQYSTMEKGNVSEQANDEKNGAMSNRECDHQSTELKRKGLRLVPVSTVVKYQLG